MFLGIAWKAQRVFPVPYQWRRVALAVGAAVGLTVAGKLLAWPARSPSGSRSHIRSCLRSSASTSRPSASGSAHSVAACCPAPGRPVPFTVRRCGRGRGGPDCCARGRARRGPRPARTEPLARCWQGSPCSPAAEAGLVLDLSDHGDRVSPALAALGAAALVPMAIAARLSSCAGRLSSTPIVARRGAVSTAARIRSEHRYYVGVASAGELGRLLPLYGVLGARGARARLERAARPRVRSASRRSSPCPRSPSSPSPRSRCSGRHDLHAGENVLAYFLFPFAVLVAVVARAPFPPWMPRVLAVIAVALATLFAVVGLVQAATHRAVVLLAKRGGRERVQLVLPRHVALPGPEPVRTPRRARDRGTARRGPLQAPAARSSPSRW